MTIIACTVWTHDALSLNHVNKHHSTISRLAGSVWHCPSGTYHNWQQNSTTNFEFSINTYTGVVVFHNTIKFPFPTAKPYISGEHTHITLVSKKHPETGLYLAGGGEERESSCPPKVHSSHNTCIYVETTLFCITILGVIHTNLSLHPVKSSTQS